MSQRALAAPYAAFVMDARTGEVLHSRNADTRLHPASLTKMLTLYIAFDAVKRGEISLDTKVRISRHAASQPPSRLGLKAGQKIALRYLIRAAAIKSANDAATAIGEAISGSESAFAKRMTRTAKALGMTQSTFRNANGLTRAGHLSTARDMTIMGRRLFFDFPQYYNIFSRKGDDAGIARVRNTNRRFLASYRGADGIKTGYTSAAGFNLTASAERGSKRIIATVFGGKSTAQRNARMTELLDLGFREAPRNATIRKPGKPDLTAAVDPRSAGKTIRLVTTLKRSLRPRARPVPVDPVQAEAAAELVMAMQDGIDGALAAATDPPPEEKPVDAAANIPEETTPEIPQDVAVAALEPVEGPGIRPQPRPERMAILAEEKTGTAPQPDAMPEAAPPRIAKADLAKADPSPAQVEAGPVLPKKVEVAEIKAMPIGPVRPESPKAAPEPEEPETVIAELAPAAKAAPVEMAPVAGPGIRPQPKPRLAVTQDTSEPVSSTPPVVIATAPAAPVVPQPAIARVTPRPKPEVVTRVSASGGRHWGINLGRLQSHGAAERLLMKTALSESATLRDGLRKVVKRRDGYDANFVGLTREQADLACRRLQARAQECFAIGS
ncbi:MAG: serine hydrolase [Pseudorhodobacter sp.]